MRSLASPSGIAVQASSFSAGELPLYGMDTRRTPAQPPPRASKNGVKNMSDSRLVCMQ